MFQVSAMRHLGNGLFEAKHHEDALSVEEAELSALRRFGAPEDSILVAQGNLANNYPSLGRLDEALSMSRDVYYGRLKVNGEEPRLTIVAANNYAVLLKNVDRFEEASSVLRKTLPVSRRVLGKGDRLILKMRWVYAEALRKAPSATLDDLREAVKTLEDTARIARRVLGGAHPTTVGVEAELQYSRAALRERETPSTSP